jgi:hypothetical protein
MHSHAVHAIEARPQRPTRNKFIHGGKSPSLDALFKTSGMDQLKKIAFAFQHNPKAFPAIMEKKIRRAYDRGLLSIAKEMDGDLVRLKTVVSQLLDELYNHYVDRIVLLTNAKQTFK